MNGWLLVSIIVAATCTGDVLQSLEMKRHAESGLGDTASGIFRRPLLMLSVVFMAVSFFAFIVLLQFADLSFAVPASALSFVIETILARWILRERVNARRWMGTLLVAGGVALLTV